ncbi:MAG: putative transposase [Saprospiraceae bacterium]|jgi:putative transposase
MDKLRRECHKVSWLTVHLIFVTKYRYKVLKGEIQKRCRELITQDCKTLDIKILKGAVSKDHVHLHIEYPPK